MTPLLNVSDLVCGYDRPLFEPLNISLGPHESVAITGRSGVGKSTLIATILGMLAPVSGTVSIGGTNVHTLSFSSLAKLRSQKVGTIFQGGELLSQYTAQENVALPRLLRDPHDRQASDEAATLLSQLGIEPSRLARDLSGGERQRTALARALIVHPQLILADEPTGALDPAARDSVVEAIFHAIENADCALLVVTHDDVVAARADAWIRLRDASAPTRNI